MISSIVIGYNKIKYKMLWWELSKKKSWVIKKKWEPMCK